MVVVTGTREGMTESDWEDAVAASGFTITHVVHGGCPDPRDKTRGRSVDMLAKEWAHKNAIPSTTVRADWEGWRKRGQVKRAGPERNEKMLRNYGAEACLALWDGRSRGTRGCVELAKSILGPQRVHVHVVPAKGDV